MHVELVSQVAQAVRRVRPGRAERPPADRSAAAVSPRGGGRRSRRWPASCPPRPGVPLSRWTLPGAGRRGRRRGAGRRRSRPPRCAAGWPRTRSSPGSTGPGSSPATPTSRPRPPGCWTCTPAAGTASRSATDEYVISADEKTPAPGPLPPPPRPAARARPARCGSSSSTTAAAPWPTWPPTTSTAPSVIGRIAPTTGIDPFTELVDPGHDHRALRLSAERVFWVVDNGSSHRGQASIDRMSTGLADRDPGPPARPRLLAEPGRDLLLHPATQGHHPRRLHRPRRPRRPDPRLPRPLQRHRHAVRLDASPAPTSTDSSPESPPTRPPRLSRARGWPPPDRHRHVLPARTTKWSTLELHRCKIVVVSARGSAEPPSSLCLRRLVMTRRSPYVIELSAVDRAALQQRARAYTAPHHQGDAGEDRAASCGWAGEHGDRRPARRGRCSGVPSGASGSTRKAWTA